MAGYAKGRRFEHEIIALFRRAGYVVTRAAGSKGEDGWDLHARKRDARSDRRVWIAVYVQTKIFKV